MTSSSEPNPVQAVVGAGVVLIGIGLAVGALSVPSAAGYGGVGPNFLPWACAAALFVCGVLIVREARTGGVRAMDPPAGSRQVYWPAFLWVCAGMLANAALITTIGFILSCTLCYFLAVQGLRLAGGQPMLQPGTMVTDVLTGAVISAPVFWTFTQFLAINLPGLTRTGWL